MISIFDIENDKVVPNINCHTIPELKAVMREYKDPIPALCYLYYKTCPSAAYSHLPDYDKEQVLLQDFAGGYTLEDPVMIAAEKKLNVLQLTPTRNFYLNAKIGLEKLGTYLATEDIQSGLHGNFATIVSSLSKVGKIMEEFKKLEKLYEDETKNNLRGGGEKAYDE